MTRTKDCTLCPSLVKTRRRVVPGAGVDDAKIAMIGEGPGDWEDQKGRPFVGKAGRVLKTIEWAAGINQYKVWHGNATLCFGGRNPKPVEIDACHPRLIQEMKDLNPTVIVALGGPAIRSLYRPGVGVKQVMGFTVYNDELPGIPIVPTLHPSYIMRGHWDEVALVLSHFRKAKRIADQGGVEEKLGSYRGITTLRELRLLRWYLLESPVVESIAVDTETTGLSWMDSELLCISFSGEPGVGYSVPILHRGERTVMKIKGRGKNRKEVEEKEWWPVLYWQEDELEEVHAILDEILRSDKPKAGQNIQFDLGMLERSPEQMVVKAQTTLGFCVNNVVHDTRLLSSLLSEVSPANLTVLTAYWTDLPYYEQDLVGKKSKMWTVPDEELWAYGGADVDAVSSLVPVLHPQVQDEGTEWLYNNVSIPLIRCARKLEERGVWIDQEHFDKLCRHYKDTLATRKTELNELVGRELQSPTYYQNIQQLVFKDLDLPLTATATDSARKECEGCKKGRVPCSPVHASTSADALKELNERTPHPVLPLLGEIKSLEKTYGTSLEGEDGKSGYRACIREDGRIHARWNSARAETGRFSCEAPNLMNIPKEVEIHSEEYGIDSKDAIRDMIAAPPGRGLLNADWSQAEVWVMAYETGDETLLKLLLDGQDIHAYVARELCKAGISSKFPHDIVDETLSLAEWKNKYPSVRDSGKPFVFGTNYGLTDEGAAERLGCVVEEAGSLLAHYVQQVFPSLGSFFLRIREEMFRHGTVSNRFGRRRHFLEVPILAALKYRGDLEAAVRQGYNMPIQSGAHDLHSLAHIATERELSSYVWTIQEMHDSLLMEAPEDRLEEAAAAIKDLWEDVARNTILSSGERLDWAIPVDVKYGRSFGDLEIGEDD